MKSKENGEKKVILFNCSGHGLLDLKGFEEYLEGKLTDFELPEKEIERTKKDIPKNGTVKASKRILSTYFFIFFLNFYQLS